MRVPAYTLTPGLEIEVLHHPGWPLEPETRSYTVAGTRVLGSDRILVDCHGGATFVYNDDDPITVVADTWADEDDYRESEASDHV